MAYHFIFMQYDHYTYPGPIENEEAYFRTNFLGGVLEVPAQTIFLQLCDIAAERDAYVHLRDGFNVISAAFSEAIAIGEFILRLRERDYLARKYRITNPADYQRIHWELEKPFIFKMHELERIDFYLPKELPDWRSINIIRERWDDILADTPSIDSVSGSDELRISDDELKKILVDMKRLLTRIKREFLQTDDQLVMRYLRRFKYIRPDFSNEFYREIYDCFQYFRLIPQEIIDSHNVRAAGYARENYIKQKLLRITTPFDKLRKNALTE